MSCNVPATITNLYVKYPKAANIKAFDRKGILYFVIREEGQRHRTLLRFEEKDAQGRSGLTHCGDCPKRYLNEARKSGFITA